MMKMRGSNQFNSKLNASLVHFLISLLMAMMVAILVFFIWYPWPLAEMVGGRNFFWLLVSVDVICGPLLTLVLWSSNKSKKELALDMGMVALIQVGALFYGIHAMANARPVHIVFEVDRLRVVTASEIEVKELPQALEEFRKLPWTGPTLISIRSARTGEELLQSVDLSVMGVEPSLRPSWWQPYHVGLSQLLKRARPLSELIQAHADKKDEINKIIQKLDVSENDLIWLPLTSSKSMEWIAFLDKKNGFPRAYVNIDGFF